MEQVTTQHRPYLISFVVVVVLFQLNETKNILLQNNFLEKVKFHSFEIN